MSNGQRHPTVTCEFCFQRKLNCLRIRKPNQNFVFDEFFCRGLGFVWHGMEWYQPLVLHNLRDPDFYDGKFGRKMKISLRPCSREFFRYSLLFFFGANSIRNHKQTVYSLGSGNGKRLMDDFQFWNAQPGKLLYYAGKTRCCN